MTTPDAAYWREQYAMAVARAARLEAEVERLRAENDRLVAELQRATDAMLSDFAFILDTPP